MVVKESLGRDLLRLFIWYPFRWLLHVLPVPWGFALFDALGDVHCALSRGAQRMINGNLAALRGHGEPGREDPGAVREYFRNYYAERLCIFQFPRMQERHVRALIEFEGLERLDAAIQRGRGVVLVHGHFGPAKLPLVALPRLGYALKQIGLPSDEGLSWVGRNVAFRLRQRYEGMMPADVINADAFLRPAFKWLREKGVLMITGDGTGTDTRLGRHGSFPFMAETLVFPMGWAVLAQKTQSEILPLFVTPGHGKRFRIVVEEPLRAPDDSDDPVRDVVGRFVSRFETRVRENPGHMLLLGRLDSMR